MPLRLGWALAAVPLIAAAQITVTGVSTTATQAILQYIAPSSDACSLRAADMNRAIAISAGWQSAGSVTITTKSPHGLLTGAVVYLEGSGVSAWDGWRTIDSVLSPASFTFASVAQGTSAGGVVGVLIDDVNPALFPGSDLDTRPGNLNTGRLIRGGAARGQIGGYPGVNRVFVIGHRDAPLASDGDRYTRALQANSRHRYTLTCGSQSFSAEFNTQNPPLGDTHNEGIPIDRNNPGQYAYPTVQWSNLKQAMIDPVSGLRSFRSSAPAGTPSNTQNFVTALDLNSAWRNPSGPLATWGGAATFTGPCSSGSCGLLLRADSLTLGAPSYTGAGNSLDWVAVTISSASISAACSGDDCKLVACLTVDGVSCASSGLEIALTTTPATYTLGSKALMDLWQGSGPPGITSVDVSRASGTVNYTASSKQVTLSGGNAFNIRWGAGSQINVAGSWYTIVSVRNETSLTLSAGPGSDLNGVPYSADNFGVLVWKKTSRADQVSIGYTTFQYGSSAMAGNSTGTTGSCSSAVVTVNGVDGYDCFAYTELYWIAADGSDIRDLGYVYRWFTNRWGIGNCGQATWQGGTFDPQYPDTWYCFAALAPPGGDVDYDFYSVLKVQYMGSHAAYPPGQQIPDCGLNGAVRPCLQFTVMQPTKDVSLYYAAKTFSAAFAASGYPDAYWDVGIAPEGHLTAILWTAQDQPGWIFVYDLGDRTPAGTDSNSFRMIAAASTYRTPPATWCTVHSVPDPFGGWFNITNNDFRSPAYPGNLTTLTSTLLNAAVGVSGGLNTCPSNPFGITGNNCTAITTSGEPTYQATQVGDVIEIDSEMMRVLTKTSATNLTVQRGYLAGMVYPAATTHSGTTLTMGCGTRNAWGAANMWWDYLNDPYGTNSAGTTTVVNPNSIAAHQSGNLLTSINSGGSSNTLTDCIGSCYEVWHGSGPSQTSFTSISLNPLFAGVTGQGTPNQVDSHPTTCSATWCMDARPENGGTYGMVGSAAGPFVNVTGQLWKFAGSASLLHRKLVITVAYVGRLPLVDLSGPSSAIPTDATGSYEYCLALAAGECYSGSGAGDLYVNAPYVSYPYCYNLNPPDHSAELNSICIGDIGAYNANLVQVGVASHDLFGSLSRRLGPNYARWNQMGDYWTLNGSPSGLLGFSPVLWLDGVRTENVITVIPPYPATDSVSRGTFIPIPVETAPPPSLMVNDVIVEFGYAENGDPYSFFCTSRQESCVAVSGTVDSSTPFFYEQTETYSGARCPAGCTVAIPALSQRVLYYRWKYRDAFGNVIATSEIRATATP